MARKSRSIKKDMRESVKNKKSKRRECSSPGFTFSNAAPIRIWSVTEAYRADCKKTRERLLLFVLQLSDTETFEKCRNT